MISNLAWKNINIRSKLLITFLVLSGIFASAFYLINLEFQKKNVEQLITSKNKISQASFNSQENSDVRMLSSLLKVIDQDPAIKQLYLKKDREKLYSYIEPLFKTLDGKYSITHWYFILPDGLVFLRAHDKTLFGDKVVRKTFLAAQDTKQISSGLELGKTAFALRAVMPYYNNGELIGYVELGEEINHFITNLELETGDKFSIYADKNKLSHIDWKSTREKAGLVDNWDEYSNQLPISSTPGSELTKECLNGQDTSTKHLVIGNQTYKCAGFELITAGNQRGGMIVSLININEYTLLIRDSNTKITWGVIALLLFVLVVGLLIAFSISNPIKNFSQVAKEIATGDLTKRIMLISRDEIGQLANSFNEMVDKLQQSHQVLEDKVKERTAETEEARKQLEVINKEIQKKLEEVEKMNKLMVGRELKIIELKKEITDLKTQQVMQK